MKKKIVFCCLMLSVHSMVAQQKLDFESFKTRVLNFHPVVKQTANNVEIGRQEVIKAKGTLDPKFTSEISGKQFKDVDYYQLGNSGLKIPTWIGIDLKAGYEQNRGTYLNPQNSTPGSGLWYAGVEVPLGKGMFFDERRATIRTAQVVEKMAINERELIINDVLLDAYSSYWSWYEAFQKLKIADEGYRFAQIRFEGVKQNALLGESPSIDTVESRIQLLNRNFEKIQAEYNFQNASSVLNLFLWTENFIPLELEENTIPQEEATNNYELGSLLLRSATMDTEKTPIVLQTVYKLDQLKIEERLKKEQLKPELNVAYNPLSQSVGNNPFANFSVENYKFGVTASMPIFLRKERGGLAQTKLKIENATLDIAYKVNELKQKEMILRNELYQLYEQLDIQKTQVLQSNMLLNSEQTRFDIGESSLFLVNIREMNYLQYQMKLVELEAKMKILETKWLWLFSELD